MRIILVLAGLVLLSACNVVMTKEPLFTAADAAGGPPLRPGIWLFFEEKDCKFDESKPFTEWPDCAGGGRVTDVDVIAPKSSKEKSVLEHTPLVLAAGEPRIAQVPVDVDLSAGAEVEASGGATGSATSSGHQQAKPYAYAAVRPTKFDDQGRIIALVSWPVQCGPPPPKNAKGEDTALGTLKPLPGMEMKPGDAVCSTSSKTALRAAAKASEAWTDGGPSSSRWLRDGDR
jgi:hypothetical protein